MNGYEDEYLISRMRRVKNGISLCMVCLSLHSYVKK